MVESLLLLPDSSGGHPRALWPQHPLPVRASQEQPVLSLRLQADPLSPASHPVLASNRWGPVSANGPVSTPS